MYLVLTFALLVLSVTTAALEAQVVKPSAMLPCCVVASAPNGTGSLVVRDGQAGVNYQVNLSSTSSGVKRGLSPAPSTYRPGQLVDMNPERTRLALTPFPITGFKKAEIGNNSAWTMRTDLYVSMIGGLEAKTLIKNEDALRGFTGGIEVLLVDRTGNTLHHTNLRTYGVNPKSELVKLWGETVSTDALNRVRSVVIHHSYEPKVRLAASVGWILQNAQSVAKVMACVPGQTVTRDKSLACTES